MVLILSFLLNELHLVVVLKLLLILACVLSHAIEGRLEVALSLFIILLGCVPLLLKELEFALPKSLISVVGVSNVLVLALQLNIFFSLLFKLLLDLCLITIERKLELFVCLVKSEDISFVGLALLLYLGF